MSWRFVCFYYYRIVISDMLFTLFVLGLALEIIVVRIPHIWRYRQFAAQPAALLIGLWSGAAAVEYGNWLVLVLAVISAYRLLNLSRLVAGSLAENYLKSAFSRTVLFLGLLQGVIYAILTAGVSLPDVDGLALLTAAQLMAAICILGVTGRNIFKTKHIPTSHFYSDKELPTVTVAIPARNETAELASCIRSVVANDYPKLEVLVLDDCSQDRTPEIIKDFAQDGVRFLAGTSPPRRWLAKNHAYDQLADAANGEYILFCGVDVRLDTNAIRSLITTVLNKRRAMVSVMPLRIGGGISTAFVQPMRYWWELALPRRFFNRPPVLSTLWIIRRKQLEELGGFDAVSKSIMPEMYFARELIKNDNYAFIRADDDLNVRTIKTARAQLRTAIRTRYPQLRRRPENVLLLAAMETLLLLGPFVIFTSGFFSGFGLVNWVAMLTAGLLVAAHYLILSSSNPANSVISLINYPFVVMTEIVLLHISMYRYEFSSVVWKGRNVCIPEKMQVISKLPAAK